MEPVYQSILFATAMDAGSSKVFRHALTLAEKFGGRIHVVHAIEPLSAFAQSLVENYLSPETGIAIHDQRINSLREEMKGKLEEFCKMNAVSPERIERVDTLEILDGHAEQVIMEQARKYKADLIVMGTHQHLAAREALLGTVATRVLHASDIPVLMIRINPKEGDLGQ